MAGHTALRIALSLVINLRFAQAINYKVKGAKSYERLYYQCSREGKNQARL